jgi:hypothetical protein
MIVSAWSCKPRDKFVAAGSGVQVRAQDRDRFFDRSWTSAEIELPTTEVISVNLTRTFWTTCPELRGSAIGRWMLAAGIAPWTGLRRPKLLLTPLGDGRFRLEAPSPQVPPHAPLKEGIPWLTEGYAG